MKKIIHTSNAPDAIGPYSQAVVHDDIVYCSGQIGLDPDTNEFVGADVSSQAKQVMENLKAVLEEAGSGFEKTIKCGIYLDDMSNFETVNKIYGEYFKNDPPARETVAVKTLPKNCKVEIGCTAYI
ncbi:2-iminobutanoate/2-iminopropanoate deaminase [Fodinibius salinus]|uniref:2-iminobutanoate/2-iminopropanoate deaminase n=1 Tax=Fodinibius salinus TaxID=860790 RepID=A0A5D3YQE0_9BACT|nr:RidA family protein [Fodinibius salinus]TYP94771.1 2-iminobutanoate/2-iminopropanoate deaminase [Fodinibius salinus]